MTSLNDNFGSTIWIIVQGPLKIKQKINDNEDGKVIKFRWKIWKSATKIFVICNTENYWEYQNSIKFLIFAINITEQHHDVLILMLISWQGSFPIFDPLPQCALSNNRNDAVKSIAVYFWHIYYIHISLCNLGNIWFHIKCWDPVIFGFCSL